METLISNIRRPIHVETLQSDIRRLCGAFDLEPATRDGMGTGNVATSRVGPFDTALVALDILSVRRNQAAIRQDPGEYLFLIIQDEGMSRIEQGELSVVLSPGDMALVDSTLPSCFRYDGKPSNQISLHLPRAEMLSRFGKICTGGLALDRSDPLWIAMRTVLTKLLQEPCVAAADLSEAFLNLLGAYLRERQQQNPSRGRETLLSRALTMIDRHSADPAFSPRELAEQLNVSGRMLQRHFQPLGETPGNRLLNKRLERARDRLARPAADGIAAIAYESGFNDLSYFYRAFHRKYGMPPGSVADRH